MRHEAGANAQQAQVNAALKSLRRERPMQAGPDRKGERNRRQRPEIVPHDSLRPQAGRRMNRKDQQADDEETPLERSAKLMRAPAAQRPIDDQRRTVRVVGAPQEPGQKPESEGGS